MSIIRQITIGIGRIGQILAIALLAIGLLSNLPANAETFTVKMGSDSGMLVFEPSNVKVKAGDTVTWINNKSWPHNFVFDKAKTAPELVKLVSSLSHNQLSMKPGEENAITVPADLATGTYEYYCEPHRGAGMVGKITVQS
jgi:plastocyanin